MSSKQTRKFHKASKAADSTAPTSKGISKQTKLTSDVNITLTLPTETKSFIINHGCSLIKPDVITGKVLKKIVADKEVTYVELDQRLNVIYADVGHHGFKAARDCVYDGKEFKVPANIELLLGETNETSTALKTIFDEIGRNIPNYKETVMVNKDFFRRLVVCDSQVNFQKSAKGVEFNMGQAREVKKVMAEQGVEHCKGVFNLEGQDVTDITVVSKLKKQIELIDKTSVIPEGLEILSEIDLHNISVNTTINLQVYVNKDGFNCLSVNEYLNNILVIEDCDEPNKPYGRFGLSYVVNRAKQMEDQEFLKQM